MHYPQKIVDIAKDCCQKYDDVREAVKHTVNRVKRMKELPEFNNVLIYNSLQELVYEVRHSANVKLKRATGGYNNPNKMDYVGTESVRQAERNYYNYYIAGRIIGDMLGSDIGNAIEMEESLAEGHDYNVRILIRVRRLVSKNKKVRDTISNKKLQQIFIEEKIEEEE